MKDRDNIERILKDFMERATPEEIEELNRLLEKRKGGIPNLSSLNVEAMAKSMAESIHEQMGITGENVKRMARDLVISLARQKQPNITDKELRDLLSIMIPKKKRKALPPELIEAMADQLIRNSKGLLSSEEMEDLPPGWEEKYWENLPEPVRRLINGYLNGVISRDEYAETLNYVLNDQSSPLS